MLEAVLVLNANFEPIHVCGIHRALGLILSQRAILIANGRGELHTTTTSFPCPSVIRLQNMVHRPRQSVKLTRREVLHRDAYTCQYCGKREAGLTVDHVIPRRLHGQHTWTNVVAACSSCNHHKGGRTLAEAGMSLLRQPQEPPSTALYRYGRYLMENQEWIQYLEGW